MARECPNCGYDLANHPGDIAVNGGAVTSMGSSFYIDGTFPCPGCDHTLEYEAKFCGGYPR